MNKVKTLIRCSSVLVGGILFLAASGAHAGLINVSEIRIYNALNQALQVSEVVAIETSTGIDVALAENGATASHGALGSRSDGSGPSFAIDGVAPAAHPYEFHSINSGVPDFLIITFDDPVELDSLSVYGRLGQWSLRDVYNVEFYDLSGSLLHSLFEFDARGSTHMAMAELPDTSEHFSAVAVAEPATLALLGLGLLGLGFAGARFGCLRSYNLNRTA
ncbi:PEP-CTERM sorting domain-containing protein [Pelagibius sp. Alg239-R121]|uniref:PEP-CTERM sorting domain-containing protein n=1 Tax=Pelagibius sp. Alg239-R121 TaxID=2993448 RepID=UPI0024A6375C|nr:PEP-CTERM sorting domain-containing protein [Pelagibius sp. Alg239-R121]